MLKNKSVLGWTLYDWANSAFATTIMAAVLPVYYEGVAGKGLGEGVATRYWANTQTVAALIVAVMAPILGAIADYSGSKKRFLKFFAFMGMIASLLLFLVGEGDWLIASAIFVFGWVGFAGANIFYDAFLPEVSPPEEIDRVSTLGYALGYVGGGILLGINIVMMSKPAWFFIPDQTTAVRWCFVSVGVWWLIFSLPLLAWVKEKPPEKRGPRERSYPRIAYDRLSTTFGEIRRYKELFKFLIAFWLFNDGIGTIIKMAVIIGKGIGIGSQHLLLALLITQFIGIPCTIVFGKLAGGIGAKKALVLALVAYTIITIFGYFMTTATHFYILAGAVGLVQGGAQGLSRSIYGSMTPPNKHAEFFSFYSLSAKFSAIMGPMLISVILFYTNSNRLGIASIAVFFIVGLAILPFIDIDEGRRVAKEPVAA